VYHPLLPHQLVFLAVPGAVFCAFALYLKVDQTKFARYVFVPISALVIIALGGRIVYALTFRGDILSNVELAGIALINAYSKPGDFVVSDDGLISGLSDRLTPPDLTDLSYIRISSGNLTVEAFERDLDTYKPKIILTWADKLIYLPGFTKIMARYHYVLAKEIDYYHRAYLPEF
jgi:hypothetical protein